MSTLSIASRGPDHIVARAASSRLRILQVTDLHVGFTGKAAAKEVARLAGIHAADLVICTGDLFCRNAGFVIDKTIEYTCRYVGATCPWTLAWGNHDLENFTLDNVTFDAGMLDAIEDALAASPGCWYVKTRAFMESYPGGVDPRADHRERQAWGHVVDPSVPVERFDGFHGGNFVIQVLPPGGDTPAANLFVLNSRRWHHVPPNVLAWMRDVAKERDPGIPAACFYHVPNKEFHDLWDRGEGKGFQREAVCFEKDDGRVHAWLRDEVRTVKLCLVGHDHVNDYHGVVDGIRYEYGRKTWTGGYGSMDTEPPAGTRGVRTGAKLITIDLADPAGTAWTTATVFADGTSWVPEGRLP